MFTGLIQAVGQVVSVRPRADGAHRLFIEPRGWHAHLELGESISVSGVCLTLAEGSSEGRLCFDAVPETLSKTTLGRGRGGRDTDHGGGRGGVGGVGPRAGRRWKRRRGGGCAGAVT